MFTPGQKLFALLFFIVFIVVMIRLYMADRKLHKTLYKGSWIVLIAVILTLATLILLVRILH